MNGGGNSKSKNRQGTNSSAHHLLNQSYDGKNAAQYAKLQSGAQNAFIQSNNNIKGQ